MDFQNAKAKYIKEGDVIIRRRIITGDSLWSFRRYWHRK